MCAVSDNAKICTNDLVAALESLIEGDENKAVIYGNSAIAAALVVFHTYGLDQEMLKPLFDEIWMPLAHPALEG